MDEKLEQISAQTSALPQGSRELKECEDHVPTHFRCDRCTRELSVKDNLALNQRKTKRASFWLCKNCSNRKCSKHECIQQVKKEAKERADKAFKERMEQKKKNEDALEEERARVFKTLVTSIQQWSIHGTVAARAGFEVWMTEVLPPYKCSKLPNPEQELLKRIRMNLASRGEPEAFSTYTLPKHAVEYAKAIGNCLRCEQTNGSQELQYCFACWCSSCKFPLPQTGSFSVRCQGKCASTTLFDLYVDRSKAKK